MRTIPKSLMAYSSLNNESDNSFNSNAKNSSVQLVLEYIANKNAKPFKQSSLNSFQAKLTKLISNKA